MNSCVFFVTLLSIFIHELFADDVIISLPNGQIRGHELKTSEAKPFFAFQGIPFAEPPLGELRFQAPVPAKHWDGILDATEDRADCINDSPQNDNQQSEDCLFVNVYTPKLPGNNSSKHSLPVMFWIYGGGFTAGTSTYSMYGPDYLIEEDIVFVSFNYRLGPFGFVSTQDEVIPGNAGLKDQNLALKWTYDNIHLFGGDPKKITIFGESAGSASVSFHLLSEKSAGLFRAAIGESGAAIASFTYASNRADYAFTLLNKVAENNHIEIDNSTITSSTVLDILKSQTTETIMEAAKDISSIIGTGPCIEVPHEYAFLTESSYELFESGRFNQVPTILGFNSEEYLIFMGNLQNAAYIAKWYDQDNTNLIPSNLILNETTNKSEVSRAIKKIYLNEDELYSDNLGAVIKLGSDNMMTRSILKQATLQSKFVDLYFYQFSYHGELGMMQNITVDGTFGNVGHAEEMPYLFKMIHPYNGFVNTTDLSKFPTEDVLVQKRFIKLWTNFAKYLNPTPENSELLQNINWCAINQEGFQYLNIGENLEVIKAYPRGDSFHQWDTIYNTYGVQPFYTF